MDSAAFPWSAQTGTAPFESDALASKLFPVDALGKVLDVELNIPASAKCPCQVLTVSTTAATSSAMPRQQAECLALRHRDFSRRIPSMGAADELVGSVIRVRRQDIIGRYRLQAPASSAALFPAAWPVAGPCRQQLPRLALVTRQSRSVSSAAIHDNDESTSQTLLHL